MSHNGIGMHTTWQSSRTQIVRGAIYRSYGAIDVIHRNGLPASSTRST